MAGTAQLSTASCKVEGKEKKPGDRAPKGNAGDNGQSYSNGLSHGSVLATIHQDTCKGPDQGENQGAFRGLVDSSKMSFQFATGRLSTIADLSMGRLALARGVRGHFCSTTGSLNGDTVTTHPPGRV